MLLHSSQRPNGVVVIIQSKVCRLSIGIFFITGIVIGKILFKSALNHPLDTFYLPKLIIISRTLHRADSKSH